MAISYETYKRMAAHTSPSELNKRITFQYQAKVPDGMGGSTTTWTDVVTVWAAIWPVSASESIKAMGTVQTITHRIRIRYRLVLKSSWRIHYGNRYFAIVGVTNPNEANEWLDILCKEAS